jgi:SAM-dependent methyltransferase
VKKLLRKTEVLLDMLGLNFVRTAKCIFRTPRFLVDILTYKRMCGPSTQFQLALSNVKPFLLDRDLAAGIGSGHYFVQDLHVARMIYQTKPSRHVDIGSRIDGFVAHLLVFMPVEVLDIRKLESSIEGLHFLQCDASNMSRIPDKSVESLSCLHALEHFGLGRYGDPIDPSQWKKALREMARVLSDQGRLYLSLPVGHERVEFNAQRVFDPRTIQQEVDGQLELLSFGLLDDKGEWNSNADMEFAASQSYGCGVFLFGRAAPWNVSSEPVLEQKIQA